MIINAFFQTGTTAYLDTALFINLTTVDIAGAISDRPVPMFSMGNHPKDAQCSVSE